MEQSQRTFHLYQHKDADDNNQKFGDEGCKFLKDIQAPGLKMLVLYANNIGSEGCSYLKDGSWKTLERLDLGKKSLMVACNQITA